MGLSQLAGALLIQGAALVKDCCCLVFDKECDLAPCLRDTDCKFFPDCICIDGTCQDAVRDSCPPGYTEIPQPDGKVKCEPNCVGDPCQATDDCAVGCVCVDGRCVPSSDAFFCLDGECQRGGDLVYDPTDPDRPKGPYPTYQACCMSVDEDGKMCGCGFACTDSCQCIPSEEQQDFETYQECRAECCDPDDAGRCCYNEVIKDAAGNVLTSQWYDCANSINEDCVDGPLEDWNGGTRQIFASFTKGVDCDESNSINPDLPYGEGCPLPEYGACCIFDGPDVIDCIEETKIVCDDMPNRPGDFPQYPTGFDTLSKSTVWSDCETRRNPQLNEDFACDDCNGEKDCACLTDERCDLRECIPCYDTDPSKRGTMVRAQSGVDRQIGDVTASETVTYYIRNCVTDATGAPSPVTDREALLFVTYGCGDTEEFPITDEGSIQVTTSGTLYVTVANGKPDVQVCITLERDEVIKSCDQCDTPFLNLDPNPQPPNQNIRVRRFSVAEPAALFDWKPGYPDCLVGERLWVQDFYSAQYQDGVTTGSTAKTLYRLYSCKNQVITPVPLDEALIPNTETTTGCVFVVGNGIDVIHPNALDWSVSTKFENADPEGTCVSEAGFDNFGLFPDMPSLPDTVDFICGGVPVLRGVNPLP